MLSSVIRFPLLVTLLSLGFLAPALANEKATKSLRTKGTYGLAFAETLQDFNHLPYAENMVNAVILQSPRKVPLAEVHRILTPGGILQVAPGIGIGETNLKAAGFDTIKRSKDEAFNCRKPWPKNMDDWSHPRHAANGNAVSGDTAVGPPERIRLQCFPLLQQENKLAQK